MGLKNYEEIKTKMWDFEGINEETGEKYKGKFIDERIDPKTVPQNKFLYHCRHDDNGDFVAPVTIEPKVLVNFCGSLVTEKEIIFSNNTDPYIPLIH